MNHFKRVYMNARQGGKTCHQNHLIDPSENRRDEMQEIIIKKDRVLKAVEKFPQTKEVLTELFPEWFSQAFFSGDVFFHMKRYCEEHCMMSPTEITQFRNVITNHQTNLFNYDYVKFTHIWLI